MIFGSIDVDVDVGVDPAPSQANFQLEGILVQVDDIHYLPEDGQNGGHGHRYRHGTVFYSVSDPMDGSIPPESMDVSFLICDTEEEARKIFHISTKAPHEAILRSWFVTYSTKLNKHVVCFERFMKVLDLKHFIKYNDEKVRSVYAAQSTPPDRTDKQFKHHYDKKKNRNKDFELPYLKNAWTDSAVGDIRDLIKRLINALKLMHSCGVSCSKLVQCSSYVLTANDQLKIFYGDVSEIHGDIIDRDSDIKNLGLMIKEAILYPDSHDWPGKLMFARCFDSGLVQLRPGSDRFDLLLEHPFLEEDSDKVLKLIFKVQLAFQRFEQTIEKNKYLSENQPEEQHISAISQMVEDIEKDYGLTQGSSAFVWQYIDTDDLDARRHEFTCFDALRIKICEDEKFAKRVLSDEIMSDEQLAEVKVDWYNQIPCNFELKKAFDVQNPIKPGERIFKKPRAIEEDSNRQTILHGSQNQAMTRSEDEYKSLMCLMERLRDILYHFDTKRLSKDKLLEEIYATWPLLLYYLHEYLHGRVVTNSYFNLFYSIYFNPLNHINYHLMQIFLFFFPRIEGHGCSDDFHSEQ